MGRTVKDKVQLVKPVQKIELDDKPSRVRFFLTIALIIVGVVFMGIAIYGFITKQAGWREIEASVNADNCGSDFRFYYKLGEGGRNADTEYKSLVNNYTSLTSTAYRTFTPDKIFDGVHNIAYINQHPNTEIKVPDILYNAFELMQSYNSRALYLAPAYEQYFSVFVSQSDDEACLYDPSANESAEKYLNKIALFASDPNKVELKLLGDCNVILEVSEDYISFAEDNEIRSFIDFGWLKNAFIADYVADDLIKNGFIYGVLTSVDGYTRCLDDSGNQYTFNLYDMVAGKLYIPASYSYSGRRAIAYLHSFPMNSVDAYNYYVDSENKVTVPYVDISDGISRSSLDSMALISEKMSCAELVLEAYPLFVAEIFDGALLDASGFKDISYVYCNARTLYRSSEDIELEGIYKSDDMEYALYN